ncbi:MAG: hypothetical protein K5987_05900 [Lachnospiraceae bacterium]|nr:hypothetical protein [Lachnospiraceae bacterium]
MRREGPAERYIKKTISVVFPAFFVMFMGAVAVFSLYDEGRLSMGMSFFALFLLALFLALFVLVYVRSILAEALRPILKLTKNIRKDGSIKDMRALAQGIAAELRSREEYSEELLNELKDTREDIDDLNYREEITKIRLKRQSEKLAEDYTGIRQSLISAEDSLKLLNEEMSVVLPVIKRFFEERDLIYAQNMALKGTLKEFSKEISLNGEKAYSMAKAGEDIRNGRNAGSELLEGLYTDLTSLQDKASKTALYCENTVLDAVRQGESSYSVTAALDEIERLCNEISGDGDNIVLTLIRLRNELKLSEKQASDMGEFYEDNISAAEGLKNSLEVLSQSAGNLFDTVSAVDEFGSSGVTAGSFYKLTDEALLMIGRALELSQSLGEKLEDGDQY